jgi:hypothetical protein
VNDADRGGSCPECGALQVDGLDCWGQLGQIIVWEWEDPELLAEHFLTVASYNLQHPAQFTDEAIDALRGAFLQRLDTGIPIAEIRRLVGRAAEGSTRVLRAPSERQPVLWDWSVTIADVTAPGPREAAVRVRAWAASIRTEIA